MAGDLAAARATTQPALAIRPDLRTATVELELRHLHRQFATPKVADTRAAVELPDQIEVFLGAGAGPSPAFDPGSSTPSISRR